MSVAPLSAADRERVVALWRDCALTRPWNDADADFARAVAGPGSAVLGLVDGRGALLGTLMVGDDGHRGWFYYLAVARGDRRRGHGRVLVAAGEAWLADRGVPKVQLMVRRENAEALGFYRALGYAPGDATVLERRLA